MGQQTAVDWLIEKIKFQESHDAVILNEKYFSESILLKYLQIAKEMEEEHHENTWMDSRVECKGDDFIGKEKTFKQYYNETYGGDK